MERERKRECVCVTHCCKHGAVMCHFLCMYVYMYVYVYVYVYMYLCMYIRIYVCSYIYIYKSTYIYFFAHRGSQAVRTIVGQPQQRLLWNCTMGLGFWSLGC